MFIQLISFISSIRKRYSKYRMTTSNQNLYENLFYKEQTLRKFDNLSLSLITLISFITFNGCISKQISILSFEKGVCNEILTVFALFWKKVSQFWIRSRLILSSVIFTRKYGTAVGIKKIRRNANLFMDPYTNFKRIITHSYTMIFVHYFTSEYRKDAASIPFGGLKLRRFSFTMPTGDYLSCSYPG